jgi:hypothetical protein
MSCDFSDPPHGNSLLTWAHDDVSHVVILTGDFDSPREVAAHYLSSEGARLEGFWRIDEDLFYASPDDVQGHVVVIPIDGSPRLVNAEHFFDADEEDEEDEEATASEAVVASEEPS